MKKFGTKIICISGHAGHGKDATGEIMANYLNDIGKESIVLHYADLLKYICKQYFGWDGVKDVDGRSLLQYVGTDVVRKRDENFWVDYIGRFLQVFDDEWDYAIIPDCRFPNECDHLRDMGFNVSHVRVVRTGFQTALTTSQQNHSSETAMDHVQPDYTIYNSSSLEHLKKASCELIEEIIHTYERK